MRLGLLLLVSIPLLPYLASGIRFEHLAIPALAAWSIIHAKEVRKVTAWSVGGIVMGACAAAFFSRFSYETGIMADPLSQFIRLVMPALMLMAFPVILPQQPDCSVETAKAVMIAGAAVALFTAATLVNSTAANLLPFWVQGGEGGTWLNSQDVGRYTGMFNQPIEAGIFYSVALIAAVHVWRYSKFPRVILILAIAAIIFGGSASLSKNFVVLGAAVALAYAFMSSLISRSMTFLLSIPVIAAAPMALERVNFAFLASLQDLYYQEGVLAALSAGRFGSVDGSVSILFGSLLSTGDWVAGRGLGSQLPLDNGYLEFFYQGGVLSLLGYVAALSALTFQGWTARRHRDGKLLLVLVAYIWLASAGGPALTANRAGVVLLIMVVGAVVGIRQSRAAQVSLVPRGQLASPVMAHAQPHPAE